MRPVLLAVSVAAAAACVPAHTMTPDPEAGGSCAATASSAASTPVGTDVRWWVPDDGADAGVLDAWCAHVGPPVWSPAPSAAGGAVDASEALPVYSWNTNGGSGDLIAFLEQEVGHSCGTGSAGEAPPFVLLLQEALRRSTSIPDTDPDGGVPLVLDEPPRSGDRLGVDEVAERCGLSLLYVPSARNGHAARDGLREDRGNAILSSLPLSEPMAMELPFEGSRRVAAAANVTGPAGQPLRVASVHFHTIAKPWRLMTTGGGSRPREAGAVIDVFTDLERVTGDVPALIGGDFNTWSSDVSALERLRGYFLNSPEPLPDPTRGPFPTDHLFFRAGGASDVDAGVSGGGEPVLVTDTYRRIEATYNSDHHPIAARIRPAR